VRAPARSSGVGGDKEEGETCAPDEGGILAAATGAREACEAAAKGEAGEALSATDCLDDAGELAGDPGEFDCVLTIEGERAGAIDEEEEARLRAARVSPLNARRCF